MSAVLVTGGLGVNGAWVTRALVQQGKSVVTYDARVDTSLIKDVAARVTCVEGDILDLSGLINAIKRHNVDRVIHLAAYMYGPLVKNPYMAYHVNVDGTVNVLEAARLMDVKRVVYTSSQSVYDLSRGEYGPPTYKPMDEDYPRAPQDIYGATKLFGEHIGLAYNNLYGLDFITMRFGWIWGPGKLARHGVWALHSLVIESAMLGKPFKLDQGADQKFSSVYARDVGNSIVTACFAENLKHRVLSVVSGKTETLRDLVKILSETYDTSKIEIGPGNDPLKTGADSYQVMSGERARKELGFTPQYDFKAGIKDYIETMKLLGLKPSVPD